LGLECADERGDPGEPDEQADQAASVDAIGHAERPAEHGLDQGDGRDQQTRQRAGDLLFRDGEQPEGRADLEQREEQQPGPRRQQGAQLASRRRERQEQERREEGPGEHDRGG